MLETCDDLLCTWLSVRLPASRRWTALSALCARRVGRRDPALLRLLLHLEHPTRRRTRSRERRAPTRPERQAAAVALLQLCRHRPELRDSARVQAAIARGLALALPARLSTPQILPQLLSRDECARLLALARAHGAEHGWSSLHRRYPTVDMPVAALSGGPAIAASVAERALPAFERFFGAEYGPPESLVVRDCFVAKYDAEGQAGLGGHLDESVLSLVMTLNETSEFEGGGTYFEHADLHVAPEQGDAVCFLGKVLHEGRPITRGHRFVLVALVDRRPAAEPPTS